MKKFTLIAALAGLTLGAVTFAAEQTPDTGSGSDIGQGKPAANDITGDGAVDASDVLEVFINWGSYLFAAEHNKADLNFDGMVDVDDLMLVLNDYGSSSGADADSITPD